MVKANHALINSAQDCKMIWMVELSSEPVGPVVFVGISSALFDLSNGSVSKKYYIRNV